MKSALNKSFAPISPFSEKIQAKEPVAKNKRWGSFLAFDFRLRQICGPNYMISRAVVDQFLF